MRTLILTFAVVCCATLTSGCAYGMTAEKLTPAYEAAGVTVRIITPRRQLSGELIDLRDDGLLIISDKVVRLVPYSSIASAQFDQTKDKIEGHPPSGKRRERLRLLSRYPQGVGPDLLRDLLRAFGQNELKGIEP